MNLTPSQKPMSSLVTPSVSQSFRLSNNSSGSSDDASSSPLLASLLCQPQNISECTSPSQASGIQKSPESPDMWISKLVLYTQDKELLQSVDGWLNDGIICAAQSLLKSQSKGRIDGWQSTQFCKQADRFQKIMRSPFIQILHLKNHWVTVSNVALRGNPDYMKDSVDIYDSGLSTHVSLETRKLICSFFKCEQDVMNFDLINSQKQENCNDCGLFAIASATELVFGVDPAICSWDCTRMRPHLLSCLEKGIMSRFPSIRKRVSLGTRIRKPTKPSMEKIYCICRMPNEKGRSMIECEGCLKWFHHDCMSLDPGNTITRMT